MIQSPGISPWRLYFLMLALAACTLALLARVAYLQIVEHQEFVRLADKAHWDRQSIPPQRGAIRDRNGNPLAISISSWEVGLDFTHVKNPDLRASAIGRVAKALGLPTDQVEARVRASDGGPVRIADNVEFTIGAALAAANPPGVILDERVRRTYPEGSLAAPLLGFVGRDRAGLTGLEADFDRDLAGVAGQLVFERDSVGKPIPLGHQSATLSKAGADLVLTIDRYLQRIVERELTEAIARHKAEGGTIIVMHPQSGAILALASRPTFDLRSPDLSDEKGRELIRNRAVTDMYEPGSTFKVITMSAAINEGAVTPETTHFDGGPNVKYGRAIDNWDGKHWGTQSMAQVLIRSNNVGAIFVGERLGNEKFYAYLDRFGFGRPTYVGLSGESAGSYRTPQHPGFTPIDGATNTFGQGITVTPLQMVTAVSAVVNGGQLMRPYVVDRIDGPEGQRRFQPVVDRQVLSEQTSRTMRDLMKAVAEQGTSNKADVPGFLVGVKTGTANMIADTGGYSSATIASVVGFFPYPDPKAVVLVKLDHPKDSPWGSQVAAPVFAAVAREALVYWRTPPAPTALARAP